MEQKVYLADDGKPGASPRRTCTRVLAFIMDDWKKGTWSTRFDKSFGRMVNTWLGVVFVWLYFELGELYKSTVFETFISITAMVVGNVIAACSIFTTVHFLFLVLWCYVVGAFARRYPEYLAERRRQEIEDDGGLGVPSLPSGRGSIDEERPPMEEVHFADGED